MARRALAMMVAIAILSALAFFFYRPTTTSAGMTVHFMDVGQGGGVFIEKDGQNILYDCGDTFAGKGVLRYLEAHAVKIIDFMVISHAHKDHMGGCIDVLKSQIKVRKVLHNGSNASTNIWTEFLNTARGKAELEQIEHDTKEGGMEILVAYDSHGRFSKEADNSILVRLVDGQIQVLLTGDCEAVCEKEIMKESDVKATVLNVGHHGSNASSSTPFLNQVAPKISVISVGAGNQYGHPTLPALERLAEAKTHVYRTDLNGSVVVNSDGNTVTVDTEK